MNQKQELFGHLYRKLNKIRPEERPKGVALTKNCIIYTRVSDTSQELKFSLDFQKEQCEALAKREGYNIIEYFGGKAESASKEERKEFERMLQYARLRKGNISFIIVYSLDRFSRKGIADEPLINELKSKGIFVLSANQPIDHTSLAGDFQRQILMAASNYEIKVKNKRCSDGKTKSVSMGNLLVKPPMGYDFYWKDNKRIIEINREEGAVIKKIFHWKANEGLRNADILRRLETMGYQWKNRKVYEILRNPTYCGYVVWKPAGGAVPGTHPKIVTEEVWIKANQPAPSRDKRVKPVITEDRIPLKKFCRCHSCHCHITGFRIEKKGLYYYRCQVPGHISVNADKLNERFKELLGRVSIPEAYTGLLKRQLMLLVKGLNEEREDTRRELEKRMKDITVKLDRIEERYIVDADITREQFDKFSSKLMEEKGQIQVELSKGHFKISNLEIYIDKALDFAMKLPSVWDCSGYAEKQQLQWAVFPSGIDYDGKNHQYLTPQLSPLFSWIADQKSNTENGGLSGNNEKPIFVGRLSTANDQLLHFQLLLDKIRH
jgi:site-specific DNA recombinase